MRSTSDFYAQSKGSTAKGKQLSTSNRYIEEIKNHNSDPLMHPCDEEYHSDESSSLEGGDQRRISSSSKVNFSKLTKKEQSQRFKNMQRKIQRLQI